ncbi:MAG: FHA domain-containing protein, partial [Moraxellaceae bacterium]
MALQITLVKTPGNVSISNPTQTFGERGGTLGRGEKNTWVLPDPDKFLSSCHCEIKCEGNSYVIIDLSTNGTFLNNSPEPLGRGSGSPLRDGDTFEIGDYRFAVKTVQSQGYSSDSPFASRDFAATSTSNDIFGSASSSASLFADPFVGNLNPVQDFSRSPHGESLDPLVALDRMRGTPVSTPMFNTNEFNSADIFGSRAKPAIPENDYFG